VNFAVRSAAGVVFQPFDFRLRQTRVLCHVSKELHRVGREFLQDVDAELGLVLAGMNFQRAAHARGGFATCCAVSFSVPSFIKSVVRLATPMRPELH